MGCKFSKAKFFRRKRSKATGDDQEVTAHLKKRDRGGKYQERLGTLDELQGEASDTQAVQTLVQGGLNKKIANELVLRHEKGFLNATGDIANVLEKHNTKYYLQLQDNILVRVNSIGELSYEKLGNEIREEIPKKGLAHLKDKISINTASEKELEKIKGIGPTLAHRIVQYRKEHGPFTSIEDVASVRGVSEKLLERISSEVTIETSQSSQNRNYERRGTQNITPQDNTVRVASWNLLSFSSDKAENSGVLEVVCCTILENGIEILAVQEVADENALNKIKDELNNPTIDAVKSFKHRGHWQCCTSDVAGYMFRSKEYNGFLWNTSSSKGIKLKSDALLNKPKQGHKQFARRPYLGFFEAKKFDFVLVSVHLKATGLGNSDLERLEKELSKVPDLVDALETHIPGEKDVIILGDFNLGPDEEEFDLMRKRKLENLIPGTTFTNISLKNMQGSKNYDNIWIGKSTKSHHFTGQAGVIRDGLTHPSIPNGWRWNGVVSDHCPVWAEFYCDRDYDRATGHVTVDDIFIDGKQREG